MVFQKKRYWKTMKTTTNPNNRLFYCRIAIFFQLFSASNFDNLTTWSKLPKAQATSRLHKVAICSKINPKQSFFMMMIDSDWWFTRTCHHSTKDLVEFFSFQNSLPFLKASTQSPSTPLFLRSLRRAVGGRCIMHPPMLPASTGDGVHPQEVCTEHVWSKFFPSGNSRSIASTNTRLPSHRLRNLKIWDLKALKIPVLLVAVIKRCNCTHSGKSTAKNCDGCVLGVIVDRDDPRRTCTKHYYLLLNRLSVFVGSKYVKTIKK